MLAFVSIPESGFCLFGLDIGGNTLNLLVAFQSLSRDSVCLDLRGDGLRFIKQGVSIPESGFCLFGQHVRLIMARRLFVSIPESGFCLFGPGLMSGTVGKFGCFNP